MVHSKGTAGTQKWIYHCSLLLLILLLWRIVLRWWGHNTSTHTGFCHSARVQGEGGHTPAPTLPLFWMHSFGNIATCHVPKHSRYTPTLERPSLLALLRFPGEAHGMCTLHLLPHRKSAAKGLEWASCQFTADVRNRRKEMKTQLSTSN